MIIGYKKQFPDKIIAGTKRHTFREDPHNRWHAGMKMHQSTGVRTKQYKLIRIDICNGIQKIEIIHRAGEVFIKIDDKHYFDSINFNTDNINNIAQIATNDGFDSVEAFFEWFSSDFTGKIIHWTDLRY